MTKIFHAFVTSTNDDLERFFNTLEIFYRRFNPDREFNYVDLNSGPSTPILHSDPNHILDILVNKDNKDRKKYNITVDYDYVILHWTGATMQGQTIIAQAFRNYLKKLDKNKFLVMGHIIDGKEHSVGRSWNSGSYYFLYPITVVINLNLYKEYGCPDVGQGKVRKHLWIANRSEKNVHDNYTPLYLNPSDGTTEENTKSFGWNLIHESLKNGKPVLNLPMELRNKTIFTYPEDKPKKFMKAIDQVWDMPVLDQDNQKKWLLETLAYKWGVAASFNGNITGTVFLFNTEHAISDPEAFKFYNWGSMDCFAGPASGFKDFVLAYKKYKTYDHPIKFIHFDMNWETINLKKHMLLWDGDRNTFEKHTKAYENFEYIRTVMWPRVTLWPQYLNELIEQFDSEEEFKSRWQEYQKQEHIFIRADLLEDPDIITNHLRSKNTERAILWVSDIFLGTNEISHGLDNLKKKFFNLVGTTYVANSNVLIDYKDFQDQPQFNEISNLYETLLIKENKSFCIYPWMHVQYKPNGQPKPCCRFNLDATHYNEIDKSEFWGDTVYLQELMPLNSGKITQNKYPGVRFDEMPDLLEKGGNTSVDDAFNSNFWNKLRKNMLAGKHIPGCEKCYKEDAVSIAPGPRFKDFGNSMRLSSLRDYNMKYTKSNRQLIHMTPQVPKAVSYLEVGFGNYCNLACRSCSSNLSTTWHDDDVALGGKFGHWAAPKVEDADIKISDNGLRNLQEIKFTGGEPMIHPNFAKFIERIVKLDAAKHIKLEIFTNCSYFPSNKITQHLSEFKQVDLCLSIDGVGIVNEYARYPSQWSKVDDSARRWVEIEGKYNNIIVQIAPTITMYNVMYMDQLIDWWYDVKSIRPIQDEDYSIIFNFADKPDYLNKFLFPNLENLVDKYIGYTTDENMPSDLKQNVSRFITRLRSSENVDSTLQEFYDYSKALDKIRNQSFEKDLPELFEVIEPHINLTI
jgi:organic radical activating enzyme